MGQVEAMIGFLLLLVVGGAAFVYHLGARASHEEQEILRTGVQVTGTVARRWVDESYSSTSDGHGHSRYTWFLTVQYLDPWGRGWLTTDVTVGRSEYEAHPEGSPYTFAVSPNGGSTSLTHSEGKRTKTFALVFGIVGGLYFLGGLITLLTLQ